MDNSRVPLRRRTALLAAGAGAGALILGLGEGRASAGGRTARRAGAREAPAVTRRVGAIDILALVDASGPFFLDRAAAFPTATPADWERAASIDPDAFGSAGQWLLDFRCFVLRGPRGRLTIVDTGVGPADSPAAGWAPVPGRLPQELAAAGVDPDEVDEVVLTHLHEDHYGWSVTPDGVPVFPNARYVVQRDEVAGLAETDAARAYVVTPLRRTGQLHVVAGPARLGGGAGWRGCAVRLVPTPGHTPGHQSVLVDGGRDAVLLTGDALVHAVQLANPDVGYRYEADQELARRSRHLLLDLARERDATLATAHLKRPFVDR